jgi:hypothetical protein
MIKLLYIIAGKCHTPRRLLPCGVLRLPPQKVVAVPLLLAVAYIAPSQTILVERPLMLLPPWYNIQDTAMYHVATDESCRYRTTFVPQFYIVFVPLLTHQQKNSLAGATQTSWHISHSLFSTCL